MDERAVLIVTPKQFARGYGRLAPKRRPADWDAPVLWTVERFVKIRDLPDGNVLVEQPV